MAELPTQNPETPEETIKNDFSELANKARKNLEAAQQMQANREGRHEDAAEKTAELESTEESMEVTPKIKKPAVSIGGVLAEKMENLKALEEKAEALHEGADPKAYREALLEKKRLDREIRILAERTTSRPLSRRVEEKLQEEGFKGKIKISTYIEKIALPKIEKELLDNEAVKAKKTCWETLNPKKQEAFLRDDEGVEAGPTFVKYLQSKKEGFGENISNAAFYRAINMGYRVDLFTEGLLSGLGDFSHSDWFESMKIPVANGETISLRRHEKINGFVDWVRDLKNQVKQEASAIAHNQEVGGINPEFKKTIEGKQEESGLSENAYYAMISMGYRVDAIMRKGNKATIPLDSGAPLTCGNFEEFKAWAEKQAGEHVQEVKTKNEKREQLAQKIQVNKDVYVRVKGQAKDELFDEALRIEQKAREAKKAQQLERMGKLGDLYKKLGSGEQAAIDKAMEIIGSSFQEGEDIKKIKETLEKSLGSKKSSVNVNPLYGIENIKIRNRVRVLLSAEIRDKFKENAFEQSANFRQELLERGIKISDSLSRKLIEDGYDLQRGEIKKNGPVAEVIIIPHSKGRRFKKPIEQFKEYIQKIETKISGKEKTKKAVLKDAPEPKGEVIINEDDVVNLGKPESALREAERSDSGVIVTAENNGAEKPEAEAVVEKDFIQKVKEVETISALIALVKETWNEQGVRTIVKNIEDLEGEDYSFYPLTFNAQEQDVYEKAVEIFKRDKAKDKQEQQKKEPSPHDILYILEQPDASYSYQEVIRFLADYHAKHKDSNGNAADQKILDAWELLMGLKSDDEEKSKKAVEDFFGFKEKEKNKIDTVTKNSGK
jgi:hypothetical protein